MIPRRVRFATLLAFICHGFFILTQRYRDSYDAYTHMLFADHYARGWFSLWETRWYAGFTVVSYPPLIHQLMAILIPIIGFNFAYAVILWLITSLYPLGIYAFCRIFAGQTASSYSAIASAILLPIYVTAHVFGQLPFLSATLLALFGAAAIAKLLREGGFHNLLLAVALIAATMASHHATLLLQPFLLLGVSTYQLTAANWKMTLAKLGTLLAAAIPAALLVIWPFWKWGLRQQLQTPIDHLSRHNFFAAPFAFVVFFLPFYFPIGAVIPFLFAGWPRKFSGLKAAFVVLFILGLGGTTALPAVLFGKNWEWLTYDRFAFWASLMLTPFFGILLIRFRHWMKNRVLPSPLTLPLRRQLIPALTFFLFICSAAGSWFTPMLFPIQPKAVQMQPIVDFLNAEDHYYWRYLTFGFGDQFAYLNLLVERTTTLDGSYHTARTIPELRRSGIGQIDTAFWTQKGVSAIDLILKAAGNYGVRWGFVDRKEYLPELLKAGWIYKTTLSNGIQVWENPQFTFRPPIIPPADPFEFFSWGIFPLLALATTLAFGTRNYLVLEGERIIRKIYSIVIGIIPLSLGFWYYRTIFEFSHNQVYFTYDHALFFLCDGLALIAVILWLAVRTYRFDFPKFTPMLNLIFALCAWMTCSALWSEDWRTSIYIAMHAWLIFLLILSLRDWSEYWGAAILGISAAVLFQALVGFAELLLQSTKFLQPLDLFWPGLIDSASKAANVIKFSDGTNFLRVYGTFPHPNILAGYALIGVAATTAVLFNREKIGGLAWAMLAISISLLAVTFSRSAWLGLVVFCIILLVKSKVLDPKRVRLALILMAAAFVVTLLPFRELLINRTSIPAGSTEEFSIGTRIWLMDRALDYIKVRPVTGLGLGSFIIHLAEDEGRFNFVEPVHNVPILIFAELGPLGFILVLFVAVSIAREIFKAQKDTVIVFGALLAGLGTISLLDHYFWTLAPGRLMLGLIFGLWLGQLEKK